jgi:hypothetical protein
MVNQLPLKKNVELTNWLYSNSTDNKERFILGESGDNPLIYSRSDNKLPPKLKEMISLLKNSTDS